MTADTIHLASMAATHRSVKIFGHEIGACARKPAGQLGSNEPPHSDFLPAVLDVPLPMLFFAAIGAAFVARYAWSWFRLVAELTVVPGIKVSERQRHRSVVEAHCSSHRPQQLQSVLRLRVHLLQTTPVHTR